MSSINPSLKVRAKKVIIAFIGVFLLFLAGCYDFTFVNQPSQVDPNSSFMVQIEVNANPYYSENGIPYFGVLLPIGWTPEDSLEYQHPSLPEPRMLFYSDSLTQLMTAMDPPDEDRYWWVASDIAPIGYYGDYDLTAVIHTDGQQGTFWLDYMLGDSYNGLNYRRSNDQLIISGPVQGCAPEGIVFSSQNDIDNFTNMYPGCTQIAGSVTINGSDITNLNGLSSVTSIGGHLTVTGTQLLTSLNGLQSLTYVGGILNISNNPSLINLIGLNNLSLIERDLIIDNNSALTSLIGLHNITHVGRDFALYNNPVLASIEALSNLTSVTGSLTIRTNNSLTGLTGLDNIDPETINNWNISNNNTLSACSLGIICDYLENPTGEIYISGNAPGCNSFIEIAYGCGITFPCDQGPITLSSQYEVDIFPYVYAGCTNITGDLNISSSDITNLDGLNQIQSINGDLNIEYTYLPNLDGLQNLHTVSGTLSIRGSYSGNIHLTSLTGLESLTSVGGIYVYRNKRLQDLQGLEGLISVNGDLTLSTNDSLTSLQGLDNLQVIGGALSVSSNYLLVNLEGMTELDSSGGISIQSNGSLESLEGLENLSNTGSVFLYDNYLLNNLNGLENLSTINGSLSIRSNNSLGDLAGLESLVSLGGSLTIESNSSLQNINALENLSPGSITDLNISSNHVLSDCAVESICSYISSPGGTITINNNDDGCSSIIEVALECGSTLPCDLNEVWVTEQMHVDQLPALFAGCNSIGGDIIIQGNDITNLDSLGFIHSIGGSLSIRYNYNLADFSGLQNLNYVGQNLDISGNDNLAALSHLNSLDSIGGYLRIQSNDSLTDLSGLQNLQSIGGGLHIYSNFSLMSLEGLENVEAESISFLEIGNNPLLTVCDVESICQYLPTSEGSISIYNNGQGCNSLSEVAYECGITLPCQMIPGSFNSQYEIDIFPLVFPGCTSVQGDLLIEGNDITSLEGLNSIDSIFGYLYIHYNNMLPNLTGLEGLSYVQGIYITNNDLLENLNGLSNIHSINGNLVIQNNYSLNSLSGLGNLSNIYGSLRISNNPLLSFLDGLGSLIGIGGDLEIEGNVSLNDLAGLESLNSIGYNLYITNNPALASLESLSGVGSIGGSLNINSNGSLADLTGLEGLTAIPEWLTISGNPALDNMHGLQNLTTIGGGLNIYDNSLVSLAGLGSLSHISNEFYLQNNDSLSSLSGLQELESIGGSLYISDNELLTDLNGLESLTVIGGALDVRNNGNLISLTGLDNVTPESIWGLNITNNPLLSECEVASVCGYLSLPGGSLSIHSNAEGCNNYFEVAYACGITLPCDLTSIDLTSQFMVDIFASLFIDCDEIQGSITINGNDIVNLHGLSNIRAVSGNLNINTNPFLTDLGGLDSLETIGGDLSIYNNASLSSLAGLEQLQSVGSSISVTYNESLQDIQGFSGLQSLSGSLVLNGNYSLSNLSGLENLTSVSGALSIMNNESLTSLTGLNHLTSAGRNLTIRNNDSLTDISGLSSLSSVSGALILLGNEMITSLAGLENIDPASLTGLTITGNPLLSTCEINSVCGYLALTGNNVQIFDNGPGCNSIIEVAYACGITLPCDQSTYEFTTQYEIDLFSMVFPDCFDLTGGVNISGGDIHDLNGLSQIQSIGGHLDISNTDHLSNLSGLDNLASIGQHLKVYRNDSLTSLSGLNSLHSTGDHVMISENGMLAEISGLESLDSVGNYFYLTSNDSLINLSGLENLTYIGEHLMIRYNGNLADLFGLQNLSYIGNGVYIEYNGSMTAIGGLSTVTTLNNSHLTIRGNSVLQDIYGLENIDPESIRDLTIMFNPSLSDCAIESVCASLVIPTVNVQIEDNGPGCENLFQVAFACGATLPCDLQLIRFSNQSEIDLFPAIFPDCFNLDSDVVIQGNDITNLDSLSILLNIDGDLDIRFNPNMSRLDGLSNLTGVGGYLRLYNNDFVTSLEGLQNLLSVGGYFSIQGNDRLETLFGLENLESVNGFLSIYGNPILYDISGLANLRHVNSDLKINGNPFITDLHGLENLETINGRLEIKGNNLLEDISGLQYLESSSIDELMITFNELLSTCEIASVCEFLAQQQGSVYIYGNAPGCQNPEQVDSACMLVSVREPDMDDGLVIYPNPATSGIVLSYHPASTSGSNLKNDHGIVQLINGSGKLVGFYQLEKAGPDELRGVIDLSALPPGIYLIRILTGNHVATRKVIKQSTGY